MCPPQRLGGSTPTRLRAPRYELPHGMFDSWAVGSYYMEVGVASLERLERSEVDSR